VALEQSFHLFQRLIERVTEGSSRRLFSTQLVEPLILLVDHPERISEHWSPPSSTVERPAHSVPSGVCRRRYFPFSARAPWTATSPKCGALRPEPIPDIGFIHRSVRAEACQAISPIEHVTSLPFPLNYDPARPAGS